MPDPSQDTTPTPRGDPGPAGERVRSIWLWLTVLAAVTGVSLAVLWERQPRKNPEGR